MHTSEQPLAPELAAVAAAAEQQLRMLADEHPLDGEPLAQALADAAMAAITAGHPIAAVAQAEHRGQQHARAALSRELLARVQRAARRRREAEHDLHKAIDRAARLGLAQRDIAAAAQIAHGTVRAILVRVNGEPAATPDESEPARTPSRDTESPPLPC